MCAMNTYWKDLLAFESFDFDSLAPNLRHWILEPAFLKKKKYSSTFCQFPSFSLTCCYYHWSLISWQNVSALLKKRWRRKNSKIHIAITINCHFKITVYLIIIVNDYAEETFGFMCGGQQTKNTTFSNL